MKRQLAFVALSLTGLLAAYGGAFAFTNPCPDSGQNPDGNYAGYVQITACNAGSCQYLGALYVATRTVGNCAIWCCPGNAESGTYTFIPSECNPSGLGPPPPGENPCCSSVWTIPKVTGNAGPTPIKACAVAAHTD